MWRFIRQVIFLSSKIAIKFKNKNQQLTAVAVVNVAQKMQPVATIRIVKIP